EEWLVNPAVDCVTAASPAVANAARRERGLHNGKVVTIANGLDLSEWDPTRFPRDAVRRGGGPARGGGGGGGGGPPSAGEGGGRPPGGGGARGPGRAPPLRDRRRTPAPLPRGPRRLPGAVRASGVHGGPRGRGAPGLDAGHPGRPLPHGRHVERTAGGDGHG